MCTDSHSGGADTVAMLVLMRVSLSRFKRWSSYKKTLLCSVSFGARLSVLLPYRGTALTQRVLTERRFLSFRNGKPLGLVRIESLVLSAFGGTVQLVHDVQEFVFEVEF